ncbi:unnamed protein product [Peniophora sp. CBMAI 1063]|nr:unnamed protein product [Peniophora sp. CBMAI 1063]
MSGYSYEIAHWSASEAVKKDFGLTKDVVKTMKEKTSLPVFGGVSVETSELFFMLTWDKTETHKAFIDSPDYVPFKALFPPLMPDGGATVEMTHTHFDRDPLPIWNAKVTEHAWLTPEEGKRDALVETLGRMAAELEGLPEYSVGMAIGAIEEKPEQVLAVIGWHSVEDHKKAVGPDGPCRKYLVELGPNVTGPPDVVHVPYARQ